MCPIQGDGEARASADIIPFPSKSIATPREAQPADCQPRDRLGLALAALEAAQAEQRVALATWREAIEALSKSAGTLGQSLQTYQASLARLQGD